jgi:hypothetical protein
MEIQHVNIKVFAAHPVKLAAVVTVFHRWIQESACEELLIDVGDYAHVPNGPGVIVIGHEANYSLDNARGRLGLLYNRKARVSGGAQAAIEQALRAALAACRMLEGEPEFAGELAFNASDVEVIANDRLLAPNTEESFNQLRPFVERAFNAVYGNEAGSIESWRIERAGEPRERLRIAVQAGRPIRVGDLVGAAAGCLSGGSRQ